jgi:hypothetical protein
VFIVCNFEGIAYLKKVYKVNGMFYYQKSPLLLIAFIEEITFLCRLELRVLGTVVCVLLQVLYEILHLSAAFVSDGLLILSGEEHKSGESLDLKTLNVNLVGSRVHLGNHNILVVLEVSTDLIIDGGELLAVSAPRGIELYKDVLLVVDHKVIEGLSAENNNIAGGIGSGGFLGLKVGLGFAREHVGDVGRDGSGVIGGASIGELLHGGAARHVHDNDGREIGLLDAEEIHDSVLGMGDIDNEGLTLEGLGDLSDGGEGGGVVGSRLLREDEDVLLDRGRKDLLGSLLGEHLHKGRGVSSHKGANSGSISGSSHGEVVSLIVEGLEDDNGITSQSEALLDGIGGGDEVSIGVVLASSRQEGGGTGRGGIGEIADNDGIVALLGGGELGDGGDGLGGRAGVLGNPADNLAGSASTTVLGLLAVLEEVNGGESLDFEPGGKGGCLGGIDLGQLHIVIDHAGSLLPLRGELLAMSAPRSIELDEKELVLL